MREGVCTRRPVLRGDVRAEKGSSQTARRVHRAAAAHAATLLPEPHDWRAIEHWLRETDRAWRDGDLGSVEPRSWKDFDARLKAALAPLRDALAAARDQAKAGRQALIDEVTALSAKAMDRDVPSQVKAIQAKWQAQAKAFALAQRDERALWEQFRAACDAVFDAREAKRKQDDGLKHENRRALEEICGALEELAVATDKDISDMRRVLRDLDEQWKKRIGGFDPTLRGVESRFRNAKTAVEAALSARIRSREAAVWQTLAAKERLCEELDGWCERVETPRRQHDCGERALGSVAIFPPSWEKKMVARRDAALRALSGEAEAAAYVARIEHGPQSRREILLGLEMSLGLESPAELQAQRLALQVKQLRERFQGATMAGRAPPPSACSRGVPSRAWRTRGTGSAASACFPRSRKRVEPRFAVNWHAGPQPACECSQRAARQKRSTQGRNSISQVQALRGWRRILR